jgi:Holliday junction resolvase RusA-like endonuclease
MTLTVSRLPPYRRNKWRVDVNKEVRDVLHAKGLRKLSGKRFEVSLLVHLSDGHMAMMDVDNLLKKVLDALQGRLGGPKAKKHPYLAVIANDALVWKATVEKKRTPKKTSGGGRLVVKCLR